MAEEGLAGPRSPLDFFVPGGLDRRTGGTIYDRRIIEQLRRAGREVAAYSLADDFPSPSPASLAEAEVLLGGLRDGATVIVDGLAYGCLGQVAARHSGRLTLIALVHHPLSLETGLSPDRQAALERSELAALALARRVIATSGTTAGTLERDYGVPRSRLGVVTPGTDEAALAQGAGGPGLALLAVGALVPRKGYELMIEALAPLVDRRWRLTIVGSEERDPETAARLRGLLASRRLEGRVIVAGELDEGALAACYAAADLFVHASHYEGYGMVLAEATARGLPIVTTAGGASAATVSERAALLVPPGDAAALSRALARVLDDEELRRSLRGGAVAARSALTGWSRAAAAFAAEVELAQGGP